MTTDELLTPSEVSSILRVGEDTLENWRAKRTGPKWVKLGDGKRSPIRYPRADLNAYLNERKK